MLDGKPVTPTSMDSLPLLCCNTNILLSHLALQKEKSFPFIKKTQRSTRQNCGLTLNFTK